MKNKLKVLIASTLLLVLLTISTSFAQPLWFNSTTEEMPKAFMQAEDSNGDGKVTQDEFKGPQNDFALFDTNQDGIIELSEAPTPEKIPADLKANMAPNPSKKNLSESSNTPVGKVVINDIDFTLFDDYKIFNWDNLPTDVKYMRQPIKNFTNSNGVTHYYEAVYVSSGNLNWFQSAHLAEDAGGYLACLTSKEENSFVFSLVSDPKYFWSFPPHDGSKKANHYEISIGPFLGGYQQEDATESAEGWGWLSGEKWGYTNWAVNLDDGIIDKDPRDNTQPNDSGDTGIGQRIMGFGELNKPVPTWGDYMDGVGTYGERRTPGKSYGFIIEYETDPRK